MNVTFRQLRLFLALAEHGSITAAARACHVTQPTVSMQLRELSDSVGLPLYEQIGKKLYLTAAGEALAETARAMVDEWSAFGQRIDAMKGLARGRVRLAVVSTAKYFVPRLLGSFCASHPDVDVALEVLNRDGVVARLCDNRDDLYIMSMPPEHMDLERHDFLPHPLVVIAAESHPLARRRQIALAELGQERFILREPGSGTRAMLDAFLGMHRIVPRERITVSGNEMAKHAVMSRLGISLTSMHTLFLELKTGALVRLDVDHTPIERTWYVVYHPDRWLPPAAAAFRDYLLDAGARKVEAETRALLAAPPGGR